MWPSQSGLSFPVGYPSWKDFASGGSGAIGGAGAAGVSEVVRFPKPSPHVTPIGGEPLALARQQTCDFPKCDYRKPADGRLSFDEDVELDEKEDVSAYTLEDLAELVEDCLAGLESIGQRLELARTGSKPLVSEPVKKRRVECQPVLPVTPAPSQGAPAEGGCAAAK